MRVSVLVAAFAVALTVAGCSSGDDTSATQSSTPDAVVHDCLSRPETRPVSLTITCADANLSVGDIIWEAWSPDSATGKGAEKRNTCEPSCAAGQWVSAPVGVELGQPVDGVFTRLTVVGEGGRTQDYPLPR